MGLSPKVLEQLFKTDIRDPLTHPGNGTFAPGNTGEEVYGPRERDILQFEFESDDESPTVRSSPHSIPLHTTLSDQREELVIRPMIDGEFVDPPNPRQNGSSRISDAGPSSSPKNLSHGVRRKFRFLNPKSAISTYVPVKPVGVMGIMARNRDRDLARTDSYLDNEHPLSGSENFRIRRRERRAVVDDPRNVRAEYILAGQ